MEIENNTFSRLLRLSNIHNVGPNNSRTNFTINLNRMTETNQIVRAVCKSVSFDNNAYNVYTSGPFKNNVFNWDTVSGVSTDSFSHTITVPGFYTAQELIDILRPLIEASLQVIIPGIVLTMEIGDYSKKIEYSLNGVGVELVLGGTADVAGLNISLGNSETSSPIGTTIYTSTELPNLQGLTNVYVHSTTLSEGNLVDGDVENHNILSEIPVNVPYANRVYYESRDDELDSVNYNSVRNFDSITITLRDIDNNIIELNGGLVIVVLKIYYL